MILPGGRAPSRLGGDVRLRPSGHVNPAAQTHRGGLRQRGLGGGSSSYFFFLFVPLALVVMMPEVSRALGDQHAMGAPR
jgi:hypothetical protein